jgi:hypothetical protein
VAVSGCLDARVDDAGWLPQAGIERFFKFNRWYADVDVDADKQRFGDAFLALVTIPAK